MNFSFFNLESYAQALVGKVVGWPEAWAVIVCIVYLCSILFERLVVSSRHDKKWPEKIENVSRFLLVHINYHLPYYFAAVGGAVTLLFVYINSAPDKVEDGGGLRLAFAFAGWVVVVFLVLNFCRLFWVWLGMESPAEDSGDKVKRDENSSPPELLEISGLLKTVISGIDEIICKLDGVQKTQPAKKPADSKPKTNASRQPAPPKTGGSDPKVTPIKPAGKT